ncbi:MAG: nucleotidyltransferase family protein [Bacilli bacterium]|nr:nucleotidyltransferase family protein [Bacilli bacterium]
MNVIGVIAEYNPFHNGHKYHIETIKQIYPDSLIICVLNGYFMQRGEISVLTKEDKTKICLENDIDIVLELPFVYGTQASDIFGYYAVKILNEFKVDHIIFGSESNNIELLNNIVDIQLLDPEYENKVKEYLDLGFNYPTAMKKALNIEEDITEPNDLLGISYIKAIRQINPNIIAETIKRTSSYHDTVSTDKIISAANIREKIKNHEVILKYLPEQIIPKIHNITNNDLFNYLKFKILTDQNIANYLDVDEGIEYRILKYVNVSNNIEELISNIKTKRYTYNKINRMLLHIMIGLTKEDNKKAELSYIKILGFNNKGQNYLKSIRKELTIPTTVDKESIIYQYELKAVYLYELASKQPLNNFDILNVPIKKEQ